MTTRLLWLLFALAVVCLVFVPTLLRAEQYVICDKGYCVMSEEAFDLLHSLAKKAGKDCT